MLRNLLKAMQTALKNPERQKNRFATVAQGFPINLDSEDLLIQSLEITLNASKETLPVNHKCRYVLLTYQTWWSPVSLTCFAQEINMLINSIHDLSTRQKHRCLLLH